MVARLGDRRKLLVKKSGRNDVMRSRVLVPAGLLDHNCEVLWKAKTRQRMLDFEFVTKDHGLGGGQWQASGFGFPVFGHLGRLELSRLLGFAVHVS